MLRNQGLIFTLMLIGAPLLVGVLPGALCAADRVQQQGQQRECTICLDALSESSTTLSCHPNHTFCSHCIWQVAGRDPRCPLCRAAISARDQARIETDFIASGHPDAANLQRERRIRQIKRGAVRSIRTCSLIGLGFSAYYLFKEIYYPNQQRDIGYRELFFFSGLGFRLADWIESL